MKNKTELRKKIQEIFHQKSQEELAVKSKDIETKILEYFKTNNYKNVCIYEHKNDEVHTSHMIEKLANSGLHIYTPQVIGETEMILIDHEYEVYEKEIDVFIIPGRAFSSDGKRLGRGKGYYDRFLSNKLYKKSRKIGICFDFQILDTIATEKHDILMNKIITNA